MHCRAAPGNTPANRRESLNRVPEVRALCLRARRPLARLMIGGALVLPALAMGARPHLTEWGPAPEVVAVEAAAEEAIEVAARTAVQVAWRAKVLERERQRVSLRFADEFRISLSLAHEIHLAALHEEVDPEIAFRLVQAESSFRPRAVSPVGAVGLTQLMPSTASWLVPGTHRGMLFEPRVNLRVGFRYLKMLLDQYGDEGLALTAYNRGPGTVNRMLRRGLNPDNGYTEFVMTGDASRHVTVLRAARRTTPRGAVAGS